MPLQIRRGTNTEKNAMTVPLASGELLYVTDSKQLYIGDGITPSATLAPVTGYTDDNAKDAAAQIFTSGTHSGINFSYNTASNIINATVDLSNYTGTINASSFKGTLVADDSTMLIDAIDGKINLDGTVKGDIIPDANEVYDIGSISNRFRDLYLSGSSINLGSATITAVGAAVNLPIGSTIGGEPLNPTTLLTEINANVIADDSTVIVNTTTKSVTASGGFVGDVVGNLSGTVTGTLQGTVIGTLQGNVNGDLIGSVFGDGSTLLVDATDSSFRTLGLKISGNNIEATFNNIVNIGFPDNKNEIHAYQDASGSFFKLFSETDSMTGDSSWINLYNSRGTIGAPSISAANDVLSGLLLFGHDGSAYSRSVTVAGRVASGGTIASDKIPGEFLVLVQSDTVGVSQVLSFDYQGILSAPVMQTGVYTSAPETRPTGVKGMIIFNDTSGKFQGFDGSAWVDLS